ncbi:YdaS family helix-turn-helix protein [Wielerella bovis]|uniref:YdaS family helix-turn-helix protein n=1 Tax=Wielerella bovis TaxID=2917790 RepID=UPI002019FAEB|nr:YdaS family helix-turn-helix protein [Wielerella bovis]ULJ66655.1 helix-turn-helix domain-containing protein [Wielerella bovis]
MSRIAFKEIIKLCGGVNAIQAHFKLKTNWAIYKWGKSQIPANRCKGLVLLSQGKLKLSDLRPDLYE